MKQITTKEIFIEIKTIRVTKKRSVPKKPVEQTKSDGSEPINSLVKKGAYLIFPFSKFF